jgi:hypothetical protein
MTTGESSCLGLVRHLDTTTTRRAGFGFIHCQFPAIHFLTIQCCIGCAGCLLCFHFDKGKASWPSSVSIGDGVDQSDLFVYPIMPIGIISGNEL